MEPAGSGLYDLFVYIPTSVFDDAQDTDYLWFYNLNGVHWESDGDLTSESGFEEWRALTGHSLPDGGMTLMLMGIALVGLRFLHRRA